MAVYVINRENDDPDCYPRNCPHISACMGKHCLTWHRYLSPFLLGPVKLYGDYWAFNVENAWQYSKVYLWHTDNPDIDDPGFPSDEYWDWATDGWDSDRAIRYPMGRGAVPAYSLWDGRQYGYIDARKRIYAPLYAQALMDSPAWEPLVRLYKEFGELVLFDYDGYNHHERWMSLSDVLVNPEDKMGHGFVIAMLLTEDPALDMLHWSRPWKPLRKSWQKTKLTT